MRDSLARWSLRKLFHALLKDGQHAELFAKIHHFLSEDSAVFQRELADVVRSLPWSQSCLLLERLHGSKVAPWVPESLWPQFTFLDLEFCPYRKILTEIAVLPSRALHLSSPPAATSNPSGLGAAEIQQFLDRNVGRSGWLVGHNLRRFDLERLKELGVTAPGLPILDTLELSLLTDPVKVKHALDGAHHADADVQTNLELMLRLDEHWLKESVEWTDSLAEKLDDPGLRGYLNWVLARRPLPDKPAKLALRTSTRSPSPGNDPTPTGRVRRAAGTAEQLYQEILARNRVLVDKETLRGLRRYLRSSTGETLDKRVRLWGDSRTTLLKMTTLAAAPTWSWSQAYLLRWWDQGGEGRHELHPFVAWEVSLPDDLFETAELGATDIWEHRLLWEKAPDKVALVVHPERLYDAEVGSVEVELPPGPAATTVVGLFAHRELKVQRNAFGPSRLLFDSADFGDPNWKTLLSLLAASENALQRSCSDLLRTQPRILMRYRGSEEEGIRLQVWPVRTDTRVPSRLATAEAWSSAPLASTFLQRYLRETGVEVDPGMAGPPSTVLRVAANAGLGSPAGLRRDMVSTLDWLLAGTSSTGVLGFGEEARHALAFALNHGETVAHHQGRYGGRQRTVERTADRPGIFLGDSRPAPLPAYTEEVLLSRLPFPSRNDPAVVLSVGERQGVDVFAEVVLPIMLDRLHRQTGLLQREGVRSVVFDRRALDFRFRQQIDAYLGKVTEVQPPPAVAQRAEVLSRLTRALPQREPLDDADPLVILRRLKGPMARWRPDQETIVKRILRGENLLAVLPTGAGKSACYQVPALLYGEVMEALTIVVSPLRALMRDQVDGLRAKGIFGVDAYHGELSSEEKERVLRDVRFGWTVLLYLAPEQLLNPVVLDALLERGVGLFVVDEAHCLSEWGHDFRPEYLKIPSIAKRLASERAETPPQIVAFTATATPAVQQELIRILELQPKPVLASVSRTNLFPAIELLEEADEATRLDRLEAFIRQRVGQYGLIYAFRRRDTERVCQALRERLDDVMPRNAIEFLHAGAPDRALREQGFLLPDRPTRILVATTAFGMGIDKPDIEWIAHYNAPQTVEDYAQQVGRGARDPGRRAEILTLVHPSDLFSKDSPVGEVELGMVLDWLRLRSGGATLLDVEIGQLPTDTGLKEEDAKAALFTLERSGVLLVEQWSAALAVAVKTGVTPADADRHELELLQATPDDGQLTFERLQRVDPELSQSEWVRKQKLLIRSGALRLLDQLVVRLTHERVGSVLQGWEEREWRLARWLETAFRQQMGRPLRLPLSKLLEEMGPGASLQALEKALTCWRASRLIYQTRGLMDVTLSRAKEPNFLEVLEQERSARAALFEEVVEAFPEPLVLSKRGGDHERWRPAIVGLEARGVVTVEDQGASTFRYRVKLLTPPSQDLERLASVDFVPRRRAHRERGAAVADLFSKARAGQEIWSFLEDYFTRQESAEVEALRSRLIQGLTDQQKTAAMATGGQPLLINAGAGSGKTHVLSRRLMMLQGLEMVDARKLLVLSFSKAGAAAIGGRARAVGASYRLGPVTCLTFHAFAYRILSMFSYRKALVGRRRLPAQLQQANDWRREQTFNAVMAEHFEEVLAGCQRLKTPSETLEAYLNTFDALRGGHPQLEVVVTSAQEYQALSLPPKLRLPDDRGELPSRDVGTAFSRYLQLLEKKGQTDYAGMVTDCLLLLRTEPVVRKRMQLGLRHLLVDEFQDTSRAQEEIMRLLVGHHGGLTVVGDSDQTIYTFNGSDVRNILCFADRNRALWPAKPTRVVNLEENFRSTANIVDLASDFIEKNQQRLDKRLRVSRTSGDEERQGYRRRNPRVQLRRCLGLPGAIGCAFATVRDWIDEGIYPHEIAVISRLNPAANKPKQVLERLKEAFVAHGVPVAETGSSPRHLAEVVGHLAGRRPELTLQQLSEQPELAPDLDSAAVTQAIALGLETVGEWAAATEEEKSNPHADRSFDVPGVNLLTIHQSKGREYRRVVVMHLGDKFFPPAQSTPKDFEEERRVLYVALTRAEEQLMVTGEVGSRLFEELLSVAGPRADVEEWEGAVPAAPAEDLSGEDRWDERAAGVSNETADLPREMGEAGGVGEGVEDDTPDFVEVSIGQTNLLSGFQAWMEDDDD